MLPKLIGIVKWNLSGAKRRQNAASGERGAGKGASALVPASTHSNPERNQRSDYYVVTVVLPTIRADRMALTGLWRIRKMALSTLDGVVDRFNAAATELQKTEFRRARTPGEWQQLARNAHTRDYAKLFGAVVPVVEAFGAADTSDRARVAAKLNPDAQGILRTFAGSIPVQAVRRDSPALITHGLIALAILGEIDDIRDLTFYLAALHYSAMKLRIDTRKLFDDVAGTVLSTYLQNEMRGFPLRSATDRDLAAFGFRETLTDDGFDLIQNSEWAGR